MAGKGRLGGGSFEEKEVLVGNAECELPPGYTAGNIRHAVGTCTAHQFFSSFPRHMVGCTSLPT